MTSIASRLFAEEPALLTSANFGTHVGQGVGPGPSVIMGDQSEIGLYPQISQSRMDYRMAWQARSGDLVIVGHRDQAFETYFCALLGLKDVTFIEADPTLGLSVAKQALLAGSMQSRLDQLAINQEHVTLRSYLTTGHTWCLARHLARVCDAKIHVCGPTPRTARRVNDKLWFAALARDALGQDATPPSKPAFGPAAAAGLVNYLAKRADTVVVKVPDSAGSVGNLAFNSADLRDLGIAEIRNMLLDRLRATGWMDRYPVLIGVWDADVISSPSAQMWIPLPGDGVPRLQGIFEQHVRGVGGAFVGAARSDLPKPLQNKLAREAILIAEIFQNIGYFGQCSLDAVICRSGDEQPRIHWIECNGRWGGVSIPLQLAGRVCSEGLPDGLLIVQEVRHDVPQIDTKSYLASLSGLLATPADPTEGIIVLSPPQARLGSMLNWLVLASSQEAAVALAQKAISRLQSLSPLPDVVANG